MVVVTLDFGFATPKGTSLRGTASFDVFCLSQEPKKVAESLFAEGREITHAQNRNPQTDLDKILHGGRHPRVVTYTNFGDHRLRGYWVAGGQISPAPIDFHRRPYNTLRSCQRTSRMRWTVLNLWSL